jgi:hypothetical protein
MTDDSADGCGRSRERRRGGLPRERPGHAAPARHAAVEELERSAEEIETQIDALLAGSEDSRIPQATSAPAQLAGQISVLTQRLVEIDALGQQLQVDARLFGSGVEFAEQAEPPGHPCLPAPPTHSRGISALLAGLIASARGVLAGGTRSSRGIPGRARRPC